MGAGGRVTCLPLGGCDTTCVTELLRGREGPRQAASGAERGPLSCPSPAVGMAVPSTPSGPGTCEMVAHTPDAHRRPGDEGAWQGGRTGPRTPTCKAGARSGAFGATRRVLFPSNFFLLSGESRGRSGGCLRQTLG